MERINNAATRVLNALPSDEADAFDKLIAEDQYLREHVDSFSRVAVELVDGLPEIVPAASPIIWQRIEEETGIGNDTTPAPSADNVVPIRRRTGLFVSVASVAAALVIGVAAGNVMSSDTQSTRDLAAAAAETSGSTTVELTNPAGVAGVGAEVVLAGDGTGYVVADSLPTLTEDRTYQLWVIVDDQVISAGLLGNDPDVVQFRAEGDIAGIAISNEIAGGVVVSEQEPVALWLSDI